MEKSGSVENHNPILLDIADKVSEYISKGRKFYPAFGNAIKEIALPSGMTEKQARAEVGSILNNRRKIAPVLKGFRQEIAGALDIQIHPELGQIIIQKLDLPKDIQHLPDIVKTLFEVLKFSNKKRWEEVDLQELITALQYIQEQIDEQRVIQRANNQEYHKLTLQLQQRGFTYTQLTGKTMEELKGMLAESDKVDEHGQGLLFGAAGAPKRKK